MKEEGERKFGFPRGKPKRKEEAVTCESNEQVHHAFLPSLP